MTTFEERFAAQQAAINNFDINSFGSSAERLAEWEAHAAKIEADSASIKSECAAAHAQFDEPVAHQNSGGDLHHALEALRLQNEQHQRFIEEQCRFNHAFMNGLI